MVRRLSRIFIAVLLVAPYLIFIAKVKSPSLPIGAELFEAVSFTLIQALLSAVASLIFGFWAALGLVWADRRFSRKIFSWITGMFMLPNFFPPLFIVLSVFHFIKPFPFGLTGIVLIHTVINVGLVGVSVFYLMKEKLGRMIELAAVEGAGLFFLLRKSLIKFLALDMFYVFLFVFSLSFSSFSVPLLAGKIGANTLEVFIYEKIRIEGDLSQAFGVSIIQIVFLLVLSAIVKIKPQKPKREFFNMQVLARAEGLFIGLLCTLVSVGGLFWGFSKGVGQLSSQPKLLEGLFGVTIGTLIVSVGTGFLCFSGLLLIAFGLPHEKFRRFLLSFVAPSSVLTGFSLFLIGGFNRFNSYSYIAVGLTLISLPVLYRLRWASICDGLYQQIETARVLGSSWGMIFTKITVPQVSHEAGVLSGLAAFWAAGDYAISRMVAGRDLTLAMVIDGLLSSYRLELALVYSWFLILIGASVALFFWGVGRVFGEATYT